MTHQTLTIFRSSYLAAQHSQYPGLFFTVAAGVGPAAVGEAAAGSGVRTAVAIGGDAGNSCVSLAPVAREGWATLILPLTLGGS